MAERCGRLDILVNNAGTNVRKPVDQLALAEWNQVMDTNLTSAFLCCRAAHPHLKAAGGGKIINIGSMMSIFGAPFAPAYGASKGGIVQLTRSMAASWAADGIQVNAVLPGWIETELTDGARAQVPGLNERVVARTAAGRWGQPEDLAGIAVFLASAASDFVTGTAIPVDGGYSIAAEAQPICSRMSRTRSSDGSMSSASIAPKPSMRPWRGAAKCEKTSSG